MATTTNGDLLQGPSGDYDGDGLSNVTEYQDGTDPSNNRSGGKYNSDEDGDGMLDRWEIYSVGTVALDGTEDVDGDTLPDIWEYAYFGDLYQDATSDYDRDGLSNGDEYLAGTDPTSVPTPNALDPNFKHANITLSNNDLSANNTAGSWYGVRALAPLSGGNKYYWEVVCDSENAIVGIASDLNISSYLGATVGGYAWSYNQGKIGNAGAWSPFQDFGPGDRLMFAFDPDTGKLWLGKNGTWNGDPAAGTGEQFSGITGSQYPAVSLHGGGQVTFAFDETRFSYPAPNGFISSEAAL